MSNSKGSGCSCCSNSSKESFDLIILGSGSAAFSAAIKATELGKSVAMIERGTLGGTCVNVGCVPSKTLIRAAEVLERSRRSNFSGILLTPAQLDFKEVIREKNELVHSLRQAKYESVLESNPNITLIKGEAEFISPLEVSVAGRIIKGEKILVATGSSPYVPQIPGLEEVDYLISDTAFELTELPQSMTVIGGRYIALEIAQMFQRFGTDVTVLQRSEYLIPDQDSDVSLEIAKHLSSEGINIITGTRIREVKNDGSMVVVTFEKEGQTLEVSSEKLLFATGRQPNTAGLNLDKAGVEVDHRGSIIVNEFGQSSAADIYAAGDVTTNPAFVYTAAYAGSIAAENAFSGNIKSLDFSVVPWVIFTDPQVSGVGLNEKSAGAAGIEVEISRLALDNVPRALAARDTRGFIKLIRRKNSDQLIGATVIAPEGSELIMEVSLAIKYKIPVSELAKTLHPYLTLSEGIKLAAQTFDKDIKKLSCCAG
ncbi:MAG: mercury(II) reductase [Candidatus Dadabacteria bacterium]|nr:MAG: mercury(II) reductase [Candidatus Dadabacteria bacterium]